MNAQRQPTAADWKLQPLQRSQLPAVLAIERRAYQFPWNEEIFLDCLRAGYKAWAMLDPSDTLLGYAFMSMAVGEGHVLNLCIDPDRQGEGLGRALMRCLLEQASSERLVIVLLEVRKSNDVALRLYQSLGFARIGIRRGYYPAEAGREDAYVLAFDVP